MNHCRVPRELVHRECARPPRNGHAEGEQPEKSDDEEDAVVDDHRVVFVLGVACARCRRRRAGRGVFRQ